MFTLNEKVKNLKPYDPISGNYHIRLDANESFITLPQEIKQEFPTGCSATTLTAIPTPAPKSAARASPNISAFRRLA